MLRCIALLALCACAAKPAPCPIAPRLGFGVIVVGGADLDAVNLQGFVVNAHTGPTDLSVIRFEPQPIASGVPQR